MFLIGVVPVDDILVDIIHNMIKENQSIAIKIRQESNEVELPNEQRSRSLRPALAHTELILTVRRNTYL